MIEDFSDERIAAIEMTPAWAGDVPINVVDEALLAAGVPKDLLPRQPSRADAMRRAFEQVAPRGAKIDRLPKGLGVAMSLKNTEMLDLEALSLAQGVVVRSSSSYNSTLTAKIFLQNLNGVEIETVNFTPDDHPMVPLLRDTYRVQRELYKMSEDMSVWFSQTIVPAVGAVSKRARGGVYYVAAHRRDLVLAVARGLEAFSSSSSLDRVVNGVKFPVYRLTHGGKLCLEPRTAADSAAMEIMVDGIIRDTDAALDDLQGALTSNTEGSKLLGARALSSKREACAKLEEELTAWESVTSVSLDLLRDRVSELRAGIAMAELNIE